MNRRFFLLVSFLMIVGQIGVMGQGVNSYRIRLLDESTTAPIPYARISIDNDNYVYSDGNGYFRFDGRENHTITISHVSYKDRTVLVSEVNDNTIYLMPINYLLEEVNVTKYTGDERSHGSTRGEHHSSFTPFPYTINALYIPYNEEWENAPIINKIYLDISLSKKADATILFFLTTPDPVIGNPSGQALSTQSELNLDEGKNKRYYGTLEYPVVFPREGVFIVFFIADPSFSYEEMLKDWGTERFKPSKYMPYGFYLTAKDKRAFTWKMDVYSGNPSWKKCDASNKEWNNTAKHMKVGAEGLVYNFIGGVVVQFPK